MAWLVDGGCKEPGKYSPGPLQGRRREAVAEVPYLVLPCTMGFQIAFLGPPRGKGFSSVSQYGLVHAS